MKMQAFPLSTANPAEHHGPVPESADVVVVGGGIAGVMTALFLARAGIKVVLAEKGRVGAEQSGRNWGWIRQQGRDPAELPIMIEANRIWREIAVTLPEDIGLRRVGIAYLAENDRDIAAYEGWMPYARAHDLDTRILSAAEVKGLIPKARRHWTGALYTASDMRAEPWLAVPALARAAVREGAVIVEHCAVRAVDVAGGRVAGVVTEKGRIRAPEVVVAGGAWSRLLLGTLGISIPQLSVRATVARTEALPDIHAGCATDSTLAFRRRTDGSYTLAASGFHELFIGPDAFRSLPSFVPQLMQAPLGTRYKPRAPRGYPDAWSTPRRWDADTPSPFEAMRVLDPAPNMRKANGLARDFGACFPELGPVRLSHAWGGLIDTMPDVVPIIDRAASLPGLTIATGLSGHGFGIGPAIGRVVADLVRGVAVGHDLTRFRLSRFSDGSKIELGPSL